MSGHIARKEARWASVVSSEGSQFRVPWELLRRNTNGQRKRVTLYQDWFKARFRPGDRVSSRRGSRSIRGIIVRMGPKRARVRTENGSFYVAYSRLSPTESGLARDDARRLDETEELAMRLMEQHGLEGWSFQFSDATRQAGVCQYSLKVIGMSRLYCVHVTDQEVRDTILHEIAHAIVGPGHHHDRIWKATARSIGCTGDRCHTAEFALPRYFITCPRCGWSLKRHVRKRGLICKTCKMPLQYTEFSPEAWEKAQISERMRNPKARA